MLRLPLVVFVCLAAPAVAMAQASDAASGGDLAKKLANPISSLISVPFQFNYDEGYGTGDGTKTFLNIQPVVPLTLSPEWNLIVRTIVPLATQDDVVPFTGSQSGLGDVTQSFFFSPQAP
ncbi:MAG: transporter, partial [Rhodobacteraceae bacterium]|nr:transporter [Paracoccaceae bacterium]